MTVVVLVKGLVWLSGKSAGALDVAPLQTYLLSSLTPHQKPSPHCIRGLLIGWFLPIFTDFSDFLGRLHPRRTRLQKPLDTLGVEEEFSQSKQYHNRTCSNVWWKLFYDGAHELMLSNPIWARKTFWWSSWFRTISVTTAIDGPEQKVWDKLGLWPWQTVKIGKNH